MTLIRTSAETSLALAIVGAAQDKEAARNRREQVAALVSLARRQNRLSWDYRRWALEAERIGNLKNYRNFSKEATRLSRDARYHIEWARRWRDG